MYRSRGKWMKMDEVDDSGQKLMKIDERGLQWIKLNIEYIVVDDS